MGAAHTANTVGLQMTAAVLGGAALVRGVGFLAHRVGLEALGPRLLVAAVLLTMVFGVLERYTRQSTVRA
jgi:fucose permease